MDLLDQKDFASYFINQNQPEVKQGKESFRKLVSEAQLMDIYAPDAEFDMYLLSRGFMTNEFRENKGCNEPHDEGAATDPAGYTKILFEIPLLSVCSSNELILVRNYFKEHGTTFKAVVNEWLSFCKQTDNFTDRINHFMAHVIPAAEDFKQVIANNPILKFITNRYDVNYEVIEVTMGETSLQTIWNYNKFTDTIPDESWQKITDAAIANPELANRRVPFMTVGYIIKNMDDQPENSNDIDNTTETMPISTKKTLDID
jgi:hypothetical protein